MRYRIRTILDAALPALWIAALPASAQGPPIPRSPADDAVRAYMARLAREISDRSLADVRTRGDWERRRPALRQALFGALGLDPLPERTPLQAVTTSAFEEDGVRVETVVFQDLPGFYSSADLYLPAAPRERLPAILYVCGHHPHDGGSKVAYQRYGRGLARNGYAVLVVDPIQIAEFPAIHHGTHRFGLWHWQALGYTPMGVEVWCAMRAIDYLQSRPEVDPERIGMAGRSGGGTMTWFTMALDDRVKAGVTGNATGLIASHVANDTLRGHCDCAFFVNHARLDYTDVAALCAPRPILVQSGTKDWIYPPEGYRPFGEKARRLYALLDAADRFAEQEADAPHEDLPEFRTALFRWFERWLRGVETKSEWSDPPEFSADRLRAVRGPLPADMINPFVAEVFPGPRTPPEPPDLASWRKREEELNRRLDALVFACDPPAPCPLEPEAAGEDAADGGAIRRYRVASEPGLPVTVEILGAGAGKPSRVLVAVCRRDAGPGEPDWKAVAKDLPVVRVFPRGLGGEGWSPEAEKFVRRAAVLVGRTLGTMRAYDVRRGIDAAREILGAERVILYGRGAEAVLVLAAAIRPTSLPVERAILQDLPDSLLEEPALLNAARVTDMPELLALAAPRGLVFLGRPPLGFARARRIAAWTGRPEIVVHEPSLPAMLETIRQARAR